MCREKVQLKRIKGRRGGRRRRCGSGGREDGGRRGVPDLFGGVFFVAEPAQSVGKCPRRWGMYADESNCGKFYNCVDGHGFPFDCPEGLAFNDKRGVCDWPDLVERCDAEAYLGFQCPEPTAYELQDFVNPPYAHPRDCAKHFVCVATYYGKRLPRLLSCDHGTVFNPNTRTCDEPVNVPGWYVKATNQAAVFFLSGSILKRMAFHGMRLVR
ncbi:hypothetical protein HPB48_005206 [Haemaphysalis longicornis]|uniref:Chitin-binding type-2 domain-containing protein n=1 Tax=Haemaphysalis longicornis TaxID=44386 RepID=A0A9J6FH09_HAELO|nr:hypothetical protein HPB48_005206 [Haemaphysalis longicornis]